MSLRGLRRVAALLGATGLGLSGCGDSNERCVVSLADVAEGRGGFVVDGEAPEHFSGQSVAGVGDLDGDGLDDVLIGARSYFNEAGWASGRPAVVFGKADTDAVQLLQVADGQGGFTLGEVWEDDGSGFPTGAGWSVSSAGDINGDGMHDLLIGALYAGAYAVWGKQDTQPVSLEAVRQGGGGFHVSSGGGWAVSSAGDVNGDGVPDLIIGTEYYCYSAGDPDCPDNVRTHVVFGKTDTEPVGASDLLDGQGGFALELVLDEEELYRQGYPVAGPGDMNDDGLADVVVADPVAGRTYVVFGKTNTETVSLAGVAQGNGGIVITGQPAIGRAGRSVAAPGDINGDGVPDLLIGAGDDSSRGRVYVVFGEVDTNEVSLSDVAEGRGGFVVDEGGGGDLFPASLSPAGDVNGDGVPDFLIGDPSFDVGGVRSAGRTYVVFGKADTEPVSLVDVAQGRGGFVLDGEGELQRSGHAVSRAGDVNGDSAPDLLIGAPHGLDDYSYGTGRTYVVFGPPPDCATGG